MLTTGCSPPLPEDWGLKGMEWVGRKVYQHGFWKADEEKRAEIQEEGSEGAARVGDGELARRWFCARAHDCTHLALPTHVPGYTILVIDTNILLSSLPCSQRLTALPNSLPSAFARSTLNPYLTVILMFFARPSLTILYAIYHSKSIKFQSKTELG
ncbi:hypothetical protein B0H12DRAFT_1232663 [Mycena haematopus]|nr:hypothetical protein B0H12DRAFT_1232663 [Mycena haematopus]